MTTVAETYEHAGCTVEIRYDPDPLNPRVDQDNSSVMFCDHTRYSLGDEDTGIDTSNCNSWADVSMVLRKKYKARVLLALHLIDHSGITMRAGRDFSDCDPGGWDSGQVGFIFHTTASIMEQFCLKTPEEITPEIEQRALEGLHAEVKEYASYLEGDAYGYRVLNADGNEVDSCWGWLGFENIDDLKAEANHMAEYEREEQKKRNGSALMQKSLQEVMA